MRLTAGFARPNRAWGGAQRNPRYDRGLLSQPAKRATAIGPISMIMKWRITKSCRPLRGLDVWLRPLPGVPLRSTPGSILPPAPQSEDVNIHFVKKFE